MTAIVPLGSQIQVKIKTELVCKGVRYTEGVLCDRKVLSFQF